MSGSETPGGAEEGGGAFVAAGSESVGDAEDQVADEAGVASEFIFEEEAREEIVLVMEVDG